MCVRTMMLLHIQIRDLLKLDSGNPTCFASKQELSGRLWWKKTAHVRPPMVRACAHEIAHPSGGALGKVHAAHPASAEELASPQQCGRFHMAPLDVHADHMERNGIDIEQ